MDTEKVFRPSKEVLSKPYWDATLAKLSAANKNSNDVYSSLKTARSLRNKALYTDITGLVDLVQLGIKKELKGAFGQESNEYRQVSGIKFTRPVK